MPVGVNTAIFSPAGASAGIGILAADEALTDRLGVDGVIVASEAPGGSPQP